MVEKSFLFLLIFYCKTCKFRVEWNLQEDLFILSFVKKNGSKWAKLSRHLQERNDHNVKNRFFALISEFLRMPIKFVKKNIDYLNEEVLRNAENFFQCENVKESISCN